MISIDELKYLIKIEEIYYPGVANDIHLRYDFDEPDHEIEGESLKEFGINYASNFLLESYCWRTFDIVNRHLRETLGNPQDKFVIEYRRLLNKLLDYIEPYNNEIVWRWNFDESVNFLRNHIGKIVQIPDFKSTSKKRIPDRDYWKIKTSPNSNGKKIFKHINPRKANSEQEVLFKTDSTFQIVCYSDSESCIYLEEVFTLTPDFILGQDIWKDSYK